ncbi:iron-containing alcohol dehydrogenase [Stella sp.]|uniref:iron-containing alcohol dehydrogenase n=1 Tax=Stella sp. TaxID=2912054 RepID=UPI0035B2EEBF
MDGTSDRLDRAVRGAAVTREVVLERGASAALPDLLTRHFPDTRFLLVADGNTWSAAGGAAAATLSARGLAHEALVLPGHPRLKPRVAHAEAIAGRIAEADAVPVAIGAGVINDLVKRAAAVAGRPYAVVGTAASMDGYAASGAALLDGEFKRTLPCPPPVAVLADLDVLAAAPRRMAAWGYGDLAGKVVAGADWLLADALGEEAIAPEVFALVQSGLEEWLQRPERLAAGDPDALGGLMGGLLVTGFAMQAHGTSRPASGSDHQFAHLWEMEGLAVGGEPVAHGACVGIGTVAMLALYEWLLAQDPRILDIERAVAAQPSIGDQARTVAAAFRVPDMAASAAAEVAAKRPTPDRLRRRLVRLAETWPDLRPRLAARLPSAARMQARLAAAGAPAHPCEIGVGPAAMAADYRRARLIRRRYTLLDLLADMGRLDEAVASLFAPDGFWGAPANRSPNAT